MSALWNRLALSLLAVYRWISPFKVVLFGPSSHCRFTPTCSEYARQCIRKHGLLKGLPYIVWRILRCQPFSKGGYDPVP